MAVAGFVARFVLWRAGQPADRFDHPLRRALGMLRHSVLQPRLQRDPARGPAHLIVSAGVVLMSLAMLVIWLQVAFGLDLLPGDSSRAFRIGLEYLAALTLIGLAVLLVRRYVRRPTHAPRTMDDLITPLLVGAVVLAALLSEAARLAALLAAAGAAAEPALANRPVAALVARPLVAVGQPSLAGPVTAEVLSWTHSLLAWGLVAYVGWSKMRHALLAPVNAYFRRMTPPSLPSLDLESGRLGLATLRDLTWKQLLDLDTCTRCGMCLEACPALATGKPLRPREVIQGLRAGLPKVGRDLPETPVIDLVPPEAAWACVTCYACEAACPVLIEIPDKLLGMRRDLVMSRQAMPDRVQDVLHSLETRGHPFPGLQTATRTTWAAGLEVKTLAEAPDAEYLLWVGCAGALVEANVRATRALVRLLRTAGVSFAILGDEEACTGDPARRLGAEHLFQVFGEQNVDTLRRSGIRKVITRCAHCFNSLKNDYRQLGIELEVIHHAELLAQLLADGRLALSGSGALKATYHDPCYLARANGVMEGPRDALRAVPGLGLREMALNRECSFCCGGGGGHAMTGDEGPLKINHQRTRQALETGSELIAVGCPYCYQMFDDGLGALDARHVRVADIAEVLEAALPKPGSDDASKRGGSNDSV